MSEVLALLLQLISYPSITPNDAGCQKIIAERLEKVGFQVEHMPFDQVQNMWARYGKDAPLIVFAGHTDVVPPGPDKDWDNPPFKPIVKDGLVYGRGASDMKGGLAAMIVAAEKFVRAHPTFKGSIAFLITSDEEGPSTHGTEKVIAELQKRGVKIDYAIVGEPSSIDRVGDQLRIGRRGSLHGNLKVRGKQGHVAYPQLVINPVHKSMQALGKLAEMEWDKGNADFPPTSFQITNVTAGNGAANVVPGDLNVMFNFRFSTASSVESLQARTQEILDQIGLKYDLHWTVGAKPFLTPRSKLVSVTEDAIKQISDITPKLSTAGGTSDARFIAPTGAEVIELGLSHATAHHINEHVRVEDLDILEQYYSEMLAALTQEPGAST